RRPPSQASSNGLIEGREANAGHARTRTGPRILRGARHACYTVVVVAPRTFRNRVEFYEWNDAMARKYDLDRFHNHPSVFVRWIEGQRVRRIWALLAPQAGDRVLEVGCGAGHLLRQLPAGRRFGLDLAGELLQRARGRLGAHASLTRGDALELPFHAKTFER